MSVGELVEPTELVWDSGRVAKFAGITYRQLDHWLRSGYLDEPGRVVGAYLRPTEQVSSGTIRRFIEGDAWRARRMALLIATGLTPAEAGELLRRFDGGQSFSDEDAALWQQQIRDAREALAGMPVEVAWP